MASNAQLIRQLRAILQLTQTEEQIARIRQGQARTDAVRKELQQNAEDAERRTRAIVAELRALGGVPDVVSPIVGRFSALFKSTLEQAEPFDEALLQDLALEQQLQARARYLRTLAEAVNRASTGKLAERLEQAHAETVDWIFTVLAEEALGGPTKLRPTPLQRVAGGMTMVVNVPVKVAREQVNRTADRLRRTADRARGTATEVSDRAATVGRDALDVLSTSRDAALRRAEEVARKEGARGTAEAVHEARRELGALSESELPIEGYEQLSAQEGVKRIRELKSPDDIRAIIRYEETHKDRSAVVSAAESRLAALAKEVAGVRS